MTARTTAAIADTWLDTRGSVRDAVLRMRAGRRALRRARRHLREGLGSIRRELTAIEDQFPALGSQPVVWSRPDPPDDRSSPLS